MPMPTAALLFIATALPVLAVQPVTPDANNTRAVVRVQINADGKIELPRPSHIAELGHVSSQQHELYEEAPVKNKVVLLVLSGCGLGILGIDRCYMGAVWLGIIKGFTLGSLGLWALIDFVAVLVNCLRRAERIDFLGFKADWHGKDQIWVACYAAIAFLLLYTSHAVMGLNILKRRWMRAWAFSELPTRIQSFAPERAGTPVELLSCGEEAFKAMLREMKAAKREILMCWFEFGWEVPALRGQGMAAWEDPAGTLTPLLKAKAEAGVKIRILMWNAPKAYMFMKKHRRYTRDIINYFREVHPSIEVNSHPGFSIWFWYTHHEKFVVVDRQVSIMGGMDWAQGRYDTLAHPMFDPDHNTNPGHDYCYSRRPPRYCWQDPGLCEDREVRTTHPRKGWHEVCLTVWGRAADDTANHFIHRWNHAVPIFFPRVSRMSRDKDIEHPVLDVPESAQGVMRAQIVRSLGGWSGGLTSPDRSCYEAWIFAIAQAQHFIYIEQQFFIADHVDPAVCNKLGKAILKRVEAARAAGRSFRVYFLTNPSGFGLNVPKWIAADVNLCETFTRQSLHQGPNSLHALIAQLLEGSGIDASEYLSVCGLHRAGRSPAGEWKESGCYVHAKICIVDDAVAIVGSANANDRSFTGDGDSEMGAILCDDQNAIEAPMGGEQAKVSPTVRSFRIKLWSAWLGLSSDGGEWCSPDSVSDPVHPKTWHRIWRATAAHNQKLLEDVFDTTPSDSISTKDELEGRKRAAAKPRDPERLTRSSQPPQQLTSESWKTEGLRGQLLEFPMKFLNNRSKQSWQCKILSSTSLTKQCLL